MTISASRFKVSSSCERFLIGGCGERRTLAAPGGSCKLRERRTSAVLVLMEFGRSGTGRRICCCVVGGGGNSQDEEDEVGELFLLWRLESEPAGERRRSVRLAARPEGDSFFSSGVTFMFNEELLLSSSSASS